jgi:hypothetical protein
MILRRRQVLLGAFAAMVSSGCGGGTDRGLPATTFFSFTSDAGDFIGEGQSRTITTATATWNVNPREGQLFIFINTKDGSFWTLKFTDLMGQTLKEGVYERTEQSGSGGLNVGNSHGCGGTTGRFVIYKLVRAADGTIERLYMTFEQYCYGSTSALRGEISIVPGSDVTQSTFPFL